MVINPRWLTIWPSITHGIADEDTLLDTGLPMDLQQSLFCSTHPTITSPLLSYQDPHPIAKIPIQSKIDPLPLPWLHSDDPLKFWHYATIPPNSNIPPRPLTLYHCPLRSLTTFLSSLFCFSPLALHSHFHIPISVSILPFLIYCILSVLLFSCSSLCSTIVH